MLLRYRCSLEADKQLFVTLDSLPPRLQAAVVARMPEKECLHAMKQVGGQERGAFNQLCLLCLEQTYGFFLFG